MPDGRILSWSRDGTLRLWDRSTGTSLTTLSSDSGAVTGVLVQDDRILSWSAARLQLWDSRSGNLLGVFEGHVRSIEGAFFLEGGRIVSWSDREMLLWEKDSGTPVATMRDPGLDADAANEDERRRSRLGGVIGLADGRFVSWVGRYRPRFAHLDFAHGMIEGAGTGAGLHFWNPDTGRLDAILDEADFGVRENWAFGAWDDVAVHVRKLSGDRLLTWSFVTVRMWDPSARKLLHSFKHENAVTKVLEIPALRRLMTCTSERLHLWDLDTGALLASFRSRGVSPVSGSLFASWSPKEHHGICIWDAIEIKQLGCIDGEATSMQMLSNSRHLLSIRAFGRGMDVWDLRAR